MATSVWAAKVAERTVRISGAPGDSLAAEFSFEDEANPVVLVSGKPGVLHETYRLVLEADGLVVEGTSVAAEGEWPYSTVNGPFLVTGSYRGAPYPRDPSVPAGDPGRLVVPYTEITTSCDG